MPKGGEYRQQVSEYNLNGSNDKTADNIKPKYIYILILCIDTEVNPHAEQYGKHQEDRWFAKYKVELDPLEEVIGL